MDLVLIIAISLFFAVVCHFMAKKRNRDTMLWGLLGFCFGPIPVIVLLLMGRAT